MLRVCGLYRVDVYFTNVSDLAFLGYFAGLYWRHSSFLAVFYIIFPSAYAIRMCV